jgi:hypothetical protein
MQLYTVSASGRTSVAQDVPDSKVQNAQTLEYLFDVRSALVCGHGWPSWL